MTASVIVGPRRHRGWGWLLALAAGGLALAGWSILAVLATMGGWTIGWPQLTAEGYFRHHRRDLALLAGEYRAGRLDTDTNLPWRLRSMSVDSQAHRRCGFTDPQTGRKDCALFLLAWQNWRAEVGVGFAYYLTPTWARPIDRHCRRRHRKPHSRTR